MRTKSWVLLAMALGCGLVASVAISQVVLDQKKAAPEVAMVEILVAVKDIETTRKINSENVKVEKWPKDRVPPGAITDFKEADGKYASQSLFQGEPIVKKKLSNAIDSLSTTIPKGYKVFDLPVKDNNSDMNYIKPGDRVDIFGFFEKGGRVPETKTILIVENVTVKAVDGNAVRDSGEQGTKAIKSIQLLIRNSQYEAVNTATNLGKLRVALRPPSEEEVTNDESIENGAAFLSWIKSGDKAAESAAASTKPTMDIASVMSMQLQTKKNDEGGEMVIISPSGLSKYRWEDRDGMPELVTPESKQNGSSASNQMVSGVSAGNMVWNPSTSSWSTSGFSPSYPGAPGPGAKKGDPKDSNKDSKDSKSE
ncbi:MAG: Flp pilus assembly protein CpaB [Pirellulales bacterium]